MLKAALLPIARVMIKQGLGAGELVEAAKSSYIRAAISEVIPSGSRINISRVAVVTGLTRKEVAALLKQAGNHRFTRLTKKPLPQRALRVLRGWRLDPMFHGARGLPADLALYGNRRSFSLLVKKYGGDVTPVSVLRELERMNAVKIRPTGELRLRRGSIRSRSHGAQLAEFAALFKDFANTVQQSVEPQESPLFFEFRDSNVPSPRQAALFHRTFSRRAGSLLEGFHQWIAHQTKEEQGNRSRAKSKIRVGLGVYLVRDGS